MQKMASRLYIDNSSFKMKERRCFSLGGNSMKRFLLFIVCAAIVGAIIIGCGGGKKNTSELLIGFSIADLKEERWQRDRDMFLAKAKELGATVLVQDASGDPNTQIQQCDNMLVRGIKVLVVVPKNADAAAPIVENAHKKGVKVISYDRVIANADVDLYISFDNMRVGEIQAAEVFKMAPAGNYVELKGDPGDKNSNMIHEGHMKVLKPAVDSGKIKLVLEQSCDKWSGQEARRITEDALTKYKVDAIVASNDGTAAGAIAALDAAKLTGKVPISGQDADLLNCQYVVQGKQAVTVYKPIKKIAESAAVIAVKMVKGETIDGINASVNNGKIEVPTIFLDPIAVTKANIDATVIADGYHPKEKVYAK
jgi:D-xylose transport system substrate-binding protein